MINNWPIVYKISGICSFKNNLIIHFHPLSKWHVIDVPHHELFLLRSQYPNPVISFGLYWYSHLMYFHLHIHNYLIVVLIVLLVLQEVEILLIKFPINLFLFLLEKPVYPIVEVPFFQEKEIIHFFNYTFRYFESIFTSCPS